jgi:FtsP/CotA-like multicopper oxidase with cupredoxin domain
MVSVISQRSAFFLVLLPVILAALAPCCFAAKDRHYYIAAENVSWDYAPSGRDLMHGRAIPFPWRQQTRWNKTRYIEYTDATFLVRKPQPEWLGIVGPIMRAEVGDTIFVHFLNRTERAHSVHPHGLRYDKTNEGAHYLPAGAGAAVPPGGSFTYRWLADKGSGPGKGDPSSRVWWYHSHVETEQEINAGLMGPIIVTAKGKANDEGVPKDVDREFVVAFMIFDQQNGADAGLFHAINGYVFSNLPGLVMKQGERVRWYLLGMGNERDLHTPHWHGKTVKWGNRYTDVVELLPASMVTVDMKADNPGTWMFHCHVLDHMEAGMMATYTIYEPKQSCPVQFVSADFWNTPGKFKVTVRNTSPKTIQNIEVTFDHLMTLQYRRRPYMNQWKWTAQIGPGQTEVFEMKGYPANLAEAIQGWALLPEKIGYQDGSSWQRENDERCFTVFWRDQDHPPMPVLPPLHIDVGED